jgi:hypothetical protein
MMAVVFIVMSLTSLPVRTDIIDKSQCGVILIGARLSVQGKEGKKEMDAIFEKAILSTGREYLAAEQQLMQGGTYAAETLSKNLQHPDPLARLTAKVLLEWMEGKAPEYQAALEYLDYIPKRLAETPAGAPRPIGVANDLNERFGGRVAEFLALRLFKEADWPRWKILGVLFYLKEQHMVSTTEALIRFASDTQNDEWRKIAIEAINAAHDPDLQNKLAAERQRIEPEKRTLPAALTTLEYR